MSKTETPTHRFFELHQEKKYTRTAFVRVDNVIKTQDLYDYLREIRDTDALDDFFIVWKVGDEEEVVIHECSPHTPSTAFPHYLTEITLNQQTGEWMKGCGDGSTPVPFHIPLKE